MFCFYRKQVINRFVFSPYVKNQRFLPPPSSERGIGVVLHLGSLSTLRHQETYTLPQPLTKNRQKMSTAKAVLKKLNNNYSLIAITAPEPTVRPPSRIEKRRPTSIAIGVISSTSISTLSPGIHISVPSGREIVPVTSVVLK